MTGRMLFRAALLVPSLSLAARMLFAALAVRFLPSFEILATGPDRATFIRTGALAALSAFFARVTAPRRCGDGASAWRAMAPRSLALAGAVPPPGFLAPRLIGAGLLAAVDPEAKRPLASRL